MAKGDWKVDDRAVRLQVRLDSVFGGLMLLPLLASLLPKSPFGWSAHEHGDALSILVGLIAWTVGVTWILDEQPTMKQVVSACYSYRHDFGLLPVEEQNRIPGEAMSCRRAIAKEINGRCDGRKSTGSKVGIAGIRIARQ